MLTGHARSARVYKGPCSHDRHCGEPRSPWPEHTSQGTIRERPNDNAHRDADRPPGHGYQLADHDALEDDHGNTSSTEDLAQACSIDAVHVVEKQRGNTVKDTHDEFLQEVQSEEDAEERVAENKPQESPDVRREPTALLVNIPIGFLGPTRLALCNWRSRQLPHRQEKVEEGAARCREADRQHAQGCYEPCEARPQHNSGPEGCHDHCHLPYTLLGLSDIGDNGLAYTHRAAKEAVEASEENQLPELPRKAESQHEERGAQEAA
mmetsp:Transcript_53280/g.116750  ORF Transcript_53280/g.116750 Transcript_53280/m.116750 type:complete len:265 (+) Transcript_53280:149-943(+)|eukprot:CAMPEP_0180711914 /NCGR_PEP_ID=MMETSP1038_2-20121128/11105_1 /TAXON_ID=632150 /ORGANISM="Azadinium spinosum, Strain 3D9" /LENGTH=264 /DNA_ID=CAMNT_0022744169 /DNA_START=459 /DNA_END=1253 /DNA_ORIENTATION=-